MSGWLDSSNNANCFKQTYVQGFVDVSGGSIITRGTGGGLVIGGDSSLNGTVYLGDSIFVRSGGLVAPGTADNGATAIYVDVSGNTDNGATSYDVSGNADNGAELLSVSFPADASWSQIGGTVYYKGDGNTFTGYGLSDDGTVLAVGGYSSGIIFKYRTVSQQTWGDLYVGDKLGDTDGPLPDKKYWVRMDGGQISSEGYGGIEMNGDGTVVMSYRLGHDTARTVYFYSYNNNSWSLIDTFTNTNCDYAAMDKDGNVALASDKATGNMTMFTRDISTGIWSKSTDITGFPAIIGLGHTIAKDSSNNYYIALTKKTHAVYKPTVYPLDITNKTIGSSISTIDEINRPDGQLYNILSIEITRDASYLIAAYMRTSTNYLHISVFQNTSTSSTLQYTRISYIENVRYSIYSTNLLHPIALNNDASIIVYGGYAPSAIVYKRSENSSYNLYANIPSSSSSEQYTIRIVPNGTIIASGKSGTYTGYVYELDNTKTYSDVSGGYNDVSVFGGYLNDGLTSAALYVNGDTDLSGGLTVSGDVSFNTGNLFVAGDLSLNGNLFINSFAANSIGADAIDSTVDINFANKLSVSTADLSFSTTGLQVATDFNSDNTPVNLATNLQVPANIAIVDGSNGTVYGSYLTLTNKDATAYYNVGKSASGIFNIVDQASAGVYLASGGTSFTGTSDARLKTNVVPLESATDKIMALNPCTYQWKSEVESAADNTSTNTKPHVGFIAQEVEKIMPELVHPIDHPAGPDYKGVNTTDMIPYLVRTIQENTRKLAQLRAGIDEYKKR